MRPTEVKRNRNRNLGMRTKFKHCKWKETIGIVASAYVFFSFDMKIYRSGTLWLGRFERAKLSLNELLLSDAVAMSFFVLILEGGIDGPDESERKPAWCSEYSWAGGGEQSQVSCMGIRDLLLWSESKGITWYAFASDEIEPFWLSSSPRKLTAESTWVSIKWWGCSLWSRPVIS